MSELIKISNLSKIYGEKDFQCKALDGVDFEVDLGEIVAIMGSSGSGKSTLLNIIGAMDTMTDGKYKFYSDKIYQVDELKNSELHAFRRDNISFVFQQFALMKQYTVYENVAMPLNILGIPQKKKKEMVFEALRSVGIEEIAKKKVTRISGGQQQRCAIARALVKDSKLILADEPTGALDKKNGEEVMNILCKLREKGKTIILVTHDSAIAQYADRIVHIEDGRICQ